MATNFDLAPPPVTVDGAIAVPVDIQRIDAALLFDGSTGTATGDATVTFVVGPHAGRPILDLRQTVTGAFLDGVAVPPSELGLHDVGGGPHAEVRVLERHLAAGTTHILRVTYELGPPQSSTAGSYQPSLAFDDGPRLTFNFGMTDLGGGRYLEAWVPANLIFDQFELHLDVQLIGTTVAHSVITNGTTTVMAPNRWNVEWPATITALSPLLEIRASDRVVSVTDSVTLPVSGKTVAIEAWKLSSSEDVSLADEVARIRSFLTENESFAGPYRFSRFVAFLSHGAMEYDGGTTSVPSSLRHEAYHSWWGRGVKPALGRDGWWDEAWTVYHDAGGSSSLAFDFSEAPATLCTRNPWSRATPGASYTTGKRFFDGVAATLGHAVLRDLMRQFAGDHMARPATTEQIEEHLVARSGRPSLVDGWNRFVYGFTTAGPAPDLWLRDDEGDAGAQPWGGRFWDSPDVWVRHQNDGGTVHQNPQFGQDNWFHARVRNRGGEAAHFVVTFNVASFAGTELVYPGDFLPAVAASAQFHLAAGETRVVTARWPADEVPPAGAHACLRAAVITPHDHPTAGSHVGEHNNLAQKNLTLVDLVPNEWFVLPVVVANLLKVPRRFLLHAVQPARQRKLKASLLHPTGSVFAPEVRAGPVEQPFGRGRAPSLPVVIGRSRQAIVGLRVQVPQAAQPGERLRIDLVKVDERTDRTLGGVAVEVVVQEGRR